MGQRTGLLGSILEVMNLIHYDTGLLIGNLQATVMVDFHIQIFILHDTKLRRNELGRTLLTLLRFQLQSNITVFRNILQIQYQSTAGCIECKHIAKLQVGVDGVIFHAQQLGRDLVTVQIKGIHADLTAALAVIAGIAQIPCLRHIHRALNNTGPLDGQGVVNNKTDPVLVKLGIVNSAGNFFQSLFGDGLSGIANLFIPFDHGPGNTIHMAAANAVMLLILQQFLPSLVEHQRGIFLTNQTAPCGYRLSAVDQLVLSIGITQLNWHSGRENTVVQGAKGIAGMLNREHFTGQFRQGVIQFRANLAADLGDVVFKAGNLDHAIVDGRVQLFKQLRDNGVGIFLVEALQEQQFIGRGFVNHGIDQGLQAVQRSVKIPDRFLTIEPLIALKQALAAHVGQIGIAQIIPVHGLFSA